MGRVSDDRQMRPRLEVRNGIDVESIAIGTLKGSNTPLAQQDALVSDMIDVLGTLEELLDGSGHAPFEENGQPGFPCSLQQIEVLHVPCANLKDVHHERHGMTL